MSPPSQRHDLDAIRRRVSLSGLIGRTVKLRKSTGGFVGLCPFHQEKTPSFHVSDARGSYHCFGCGAHGSLFDWVMETQGRSFAEAVALLAEDGDIAPAQPAQREGWRRVDEGSELHPSAFVGQWIWDRAMPARGTMVEAYLRGRGLSPDGVAGGLEALRYHPAAPVVPWRIGAQPGSVRRAPAMVGAMMANDGAVMGAHVTYLAADGRGKADFGVDRGGRARPSRKMWGPLSGHAVWLSGSPMAARDRPLIVGEGIETVWAFIEKCWPRPCHAAAALSLDNLSGHPTLTAQGALPLWNIRPDFARLPFLVPCAGDVVVLIDADMKALRDRKVQASRRERWVKRDFSGAERASLCAALAVQHWRRAGARRVEAVRPPMGMDFNDMAKAL